MTKDEQTIANLKKLKSIHNGSYGADIDIAIKALEQQPCEDCVSRADALCVAKNEYLRGWHEALCKALNEEHSIHCEEGKFKVIQEETIIGLGLSMNCALGKDVESYMSAIPPVTPTRKKGKWIPKNSFLLRYKCSECNCESEKYNFCPNCGAEMEVGE